MNFVVVSCGWIFFTTASSGKFHIKHQCIFHDAHLNFERRAYSNYFTQLNHSSFMDTALDLDLVDCSSLYASLEAFSLANTLSGLHKFLCSELNMREEGLEVASSHDMPSLSFCSSFFNSPEFPSLVRRRFVLPFVTPCFRFSLFFRFRACLPAPRCLLS